MLIEKLAAGVVQVQTPIGPRYVMPIIPTAGVFGVDVP